ncbi:MAG: deoxynucleoside kinase, partial [Nitrospinota bacterium]|nr:deoxynucleoside kinase [Nitrospinota bacterium]
RLNPFGPHDETRAGAERVREIISGRTLATVCGYNYIAPFQDWRRDFERSITPEYLERINEAYNRYFFRYSETPLLIVNTDSMDFVHREEDFDHLVREIVTLKQGTHIYVPR